MNSSFARPTLGFSTMREAILYLHGQGYGVHTIAHDVSSTVDSVKAQLSAAGVVPRVVSTRYQGARPAFVELAPDLVRLLRPHAARRGLTSAALAALIVDTVVTSGLVDATLDDRE